MKEETSIALIKKDMEYLKNGIDEIRETLKCVDDKTVKKDLYELDKNNMSDRIGKVEKLVYSAIGLTLLTIGKAVLDLVVKVKASQ